MYRDSLAGFDSGVYAIENVSAVCRAINQWSYANGFVGAIPTFEQTDHGSGVVLGVLILRPETTQWRDVPISIIGAQDVMDIPAMMRGANDYAIANGFSAGFPTFEQADHDAGVIVGINLFSVGVVTWQDIFANILGMYSNYTFEGGFTDGERVTVLERWGVAYARLQVCNTLGATDKVRIDEAFRRSINHTLGAPAGANASVPFPGASAVELNRGNFFSLIAREQAQTLVHEMTHCAGFHHPDRRDCPPGIPPKCDNPGDNGPYYGTVALQSELCIAGSQSDLSCARALNNEDEIGSEFAYRRAAALKAPGPDGQIDSL
ncbi:hypothetical protein [Amycolatopsis sp. DSM 110486]|uniref:hypothetical protein n=1 Tax=Amycolatopsis sp. DSM 110486 TaxID=2865832 RepID=UPI001C6A7D0E|nr:hypothetical protein [Amycolatopsis sp. DSM 110486]QYN19162.1 hypothetical protein K1T34_41990 [Amycolatopsis sp. DSM 110486]